MRLSDHFTLEEMVLSQEATRKGIANTPANENITNLILLCTQILEPLRSTMGRALFVSSGYRCAELNELVGGAANSDHITGCAADITCPPVPVRDLANAVRSLAPYIPLKQCIIEFERWVHVSINPKANGGRIPQFLIASLVDGKTQYTPWSV